MPEVLRAELARPSWKGDLVALGTNTDPYQWVESRYRMMPEILAALDEADTPVSVLTKSPLVMRDVDLYERMAKSLLGLGQPLGPDPRREGLASDRAAHSLAQRPPRRRRRAAQTRHRLRRPDRPLDARHQRRPRAGPTNSRSRPRSRRHLPRRRSPPPPGRGPRSLLRLATGKTPRPPSTLREALFQRPRVHAPRGTQSRQQRRPGLGSRPWSRKAAGKGGGYDRRHRCFGWRSNASFSLLRAFTGKL